MKEKKTKIEIFLTPDQVAQLERLAQSKGESRSGTARALIVDALRRETKSNVDRRVD